MKKPARVSIIAAHDLMRAIGFEGKIPWHISADLKRFKELTLGKPIIMGRKTFESIGRPLSGRLNIVITSDTLGFTDKYKSNGWFNDDRIAVVHSYDAALITASFAGEHAFIIGGERVYKEAMKAADDMYVTVVFEHHEGDAYFPEYNCQEWDMKTAEHIDGDENEETPDYAFYYLERRRPGVFSRALKFLVSKIPGVS